MSAPTFFEGVGLALAASLVGSAAYTTLSTVLGGGALRLVVAGLGLGYVAYLLARTPVRVGRITALAAWGVMALLLWVAAPSLALYLLAQVAAVWLIRSLFFHSSLLAAGADIALSLVALAAGVWAVAHTGSLLLGIWCFFLVQALFVAIPPRLTHRPNADPPGCADPFEHAHRAAEAAVRRLSSVR